VNPLQQNDFHTGIDFGVPLGTAVYATHSGYFSTSQNYGGGTMITGKGGDGWETVYAHLSRSTVGGGRYVRAGEIIGYSGRSGAAVTGPHLHYEVKQRGKHVDPRYAMPSQANLPFGIGSFIPGGFQYDADTAARQQAQQLTEIKRAQAEQRKFEVDRSRGILGEYAAISRSQRPASARGIDNAATQRSSRMTGQRGRRSRFAV
jgi:murein DD-endopeptidase MepM/ murein hydrolase activator NlpD